MEAAFAQLKDRAMTARDDPWKPRLRIERQSDGSAETRQRLEVVEVARGAGHPGGPVLAEPAGPRADCAGPQGLGLPCGSRGADRRIDAADVRPLVSAGLGAAVSLSIA